MFKIVTVKKPPSFAKIQKEILIATSKGINETAVEAQTAVRGSLRGAFTIRNQWPEKGPLAIQVKRSNALKNDFVAEVRTRADFLPLHETGGTKIPRGQNVAIPTTEVRRTKRMIIQKGQRPRALKAKGSFIGTTKSGHKFIAVRTGRGKIKRLKVLYDLERSVRIKRQPTFFPPIQKVVNRRLQSNVNKAAKKGLAEIRTK